MTTNYGKILRKIRIDCDELLKDMADKVGVSSAFLSAVENGNKSPSEKLTESIIEKYALEGARAAELRMASKEDVYSPMVQMNLRGKAAESKDLALSFARKFDSLSEFEIKNIKEILNKGGSC
jgi:DNA-binding XRE family transcriptional regulator